MVVFDDTHSSEKVRIYDKGVNVNLNYRTFGEYMSLRSGDVHLPKIPSAEPLLLECKHFLECIKNNQRPLTDGRSAVPVIKVLEMAQKSLRSRGQPVNQDEI